RTTGYSANDCLVIRCPYLSPIAIRNPLSSHPKGMIGYRDLCYSHSSPELPIVEIVSLGAVISVSSRYRISSSPYRSWWSSYGKHFLRVTDVEKIPRRTKSRL